MWRLLLLLSMLVGAAACDVRHVDLAGLHSPTLSVQSDGWVRLSLSTPVADHGCDVLDDGVTVTMNGVQMALEDPGGSEHTVKGRLYGCYDIEYTADPPQQNVPVVFELSDASAHFRVEAPTLTSTRVLALASDGPLARGSTARVALTPTDGPLRAPDDFSFAASLRFPDEGPSFDLSAALDGDTLLLSIPPDAPAGEALLDVHLCGTESIHCEGITCQPPTACWHPAPLPVTLQ